MIKEIPDNGLNKKPIRMSTFILVFYCLFLLISLCGNFFINYNTLSFITILILVVFGFGLYFSCRLGESVRPLKIKQTISFNSEYLLKKILLLSSIGVLLGWYFLLKHYGSLIYMFQNSFTIRTETIGSGIQIVPTIVSYCASFSVVGFPLSLSFYACEKKRKFIYYSLLFFILIVIGDLQAFGRIGILYAIFLLISFYILTISKVPKPRHLVWGLCLLVILMLPRYIRGGNSMDGIGDRYAPYMKVDLPAFADPLVSIYTYYFSGIYALNNIVESDIEYDYGFRNLSAIINLMNRVIPIIDERVVIIAPETYVPFDTNIYTIVGELVMDGGIIAVILGVIVFGFIIGVLSRYKGQFALALKFVLMTWVFEIPIYNVFSFGNFLLSFIVLVLLTIFCDVKNINYNR